MLQAIYNKTNPDGPCTYCNGTGIIPTSKEAQRTFLMILIRYSGTTPAKLDKGVPCPICKGCKPITAEFYEEITP